MNELQIVYLSPDELTPYENNTRKHAPDDIESIKKSILDTGFNDPIGIWGEKNLIIEGHGRQIAAKELHLEKVPCIRLDHLTDEQRREYAIRHNRSAELSAWDFEALEEELARLNLDGIDMDDLNFNFEEMEEMGGVKPEVTEDEAPEPPEVPKTRLGDIYQLGEHRLICGDSTDPAVIDRLMDGVKADMVFTDPPYGMNLDTDYSDMKSDIFKGGIGGKKYEQGKVDEFHPEMIDSVFAIDAAEVFLWGADYFAELLPNKNDGSWIVWDKRANGNDDVAEDYSSDKMYGSCFELCWSKKKHKRDIARVKWAGIFGMSGQDQNKRLHPTQKPLELCAWFLNRYSKEGQNIVDLFGGSGSTLIACEQLNRKCRIVELDPHYCDVIIQRWENLTGRKAVLLNGGD